VSVNYHTFGRLSRGSGRIARPAADGERSGNWRRRGSSIFRRLTQDGGAGGGPERGEPPRFDARRPLEKHEADAYELVEKLKARSPRRPRPPVSNASERHKARAGGAERASSGSGRAREACAERLPSKREAAQKNNGKEKKQPRASTTEPAGAGDEGWRTAGFRPAYNVQGGLGSPGEQIVVAIDPSTTGFRSRLDAADAGTGARQAPGSCRSIISPMGGFGSAKRHRMGACRRRRSPLPTDAIQSTALIHRRRTRDDGPRYVRGLAPTPWRASKDRCTMGSARSANASMPAGRNWNLIRLTVRGVKKVRAAMLWYAAHQQYSARPSDDESVDDLVRSRHQYPEAIATARRGKARLTSQPNRPLSL